MVSLLEALEHLVSALPIDSAPVMEPVEGPQPEINAKMMKILPPGTPFEKKW
jgi:hypothetical protein